MLARDHYAALGLSRDATPDEIDSAFRHLCRRYHPDVNPGETRAARVFARIERAHRVLSSPDARAAYDSDGLTGSQTLDATESDLLPADDDGESGSFRDLFRALLDHRDRGRPVTGDDIELAVVIPLRHAERGRRTKVDVRRRASCAECHGTGRIDVGRRQPCDRCSGSGVEVFARGALSFRSACADCGGDGARRGVGCATCGGEGRQVTRDSVVVPVPPGVQDGQIIRVPGAGDAGLRGGEPGDLLATCIVEGIEGVTRRGPHLEQVVPVSIAEALLGARVEIDTPLGARAALRIPPCADTGTKLRVRGHGLAMPDGRRGDLVARVEVHVPESIDEDSRELIRRFAERNPKLSPTEAGRGRR